MKCEYDIPNIDSLVKATAIMLGFSVVIVKLISVVLNTLRGNINEDTHAVVLSCLAPSPPPPPPHLHKA